MRGGHNRRITSEQREEILRVFLTDGDVTTRASWHVTVDIAPSEFGQEHFAERFQHESFPCRDDRIQEAPVSKCPSAFPASASYLVSAS
jgi:hypothetical protein